VLSFYMVDSEEDAIELANSSKYGFGDAVIHCRSEAQAQEVMDAVASRLAECGLEMHPEKSGIVYCRDRSRTQAYPNVTFTFLGFLFRPRRVMTGLGSSST
jgi:RNA-directed DNA polymerase